MLCVQYYIRGRTYHHSRGRDTSSPLSESAGNTAISTDTDEPPCAYRIDYIEERVFYGNSAHSSEKITHGVSGLTRDKGASIYLYLNNEPD